MESGRSPYRPGDHRAERRALLAHEPPLRGERSFSGSGHPEIERGRLPRRDRKPRRQRYAPRREKRRVGEGCEGVAHLARPGRAPHVPHRHPGRSRDTRRDSLRDLHLHDLRRVTVGRVSRREGGDSRVRRLGRSIRPQETPSRNAVAPVVDQLVREDLPDPRRLSGPAEPFRKEPDEIARLVCLTHLVRRPARLGEPHGL